MLGCSLGSTDGNVLCSDGGFKLGLFEGKLVGTILVNVNGITLGLDVVTELGSLDGSFDSSNDVNLEVLLLVYSLGSTDGEVLGSD